MPEPSNIRVRFAPSPTGPLHIGGLRTALYNFLFARKHGGTMVLRIEDTDRNRWVAGAERYIMEALQWIGISYDEGPDIGGPFGPYRQSERRHLYRSYVDRLIEKGHAYYAFDTAEELDRLRKRLQAAGSDAIQYDATSRLTMVNSLTLPPEEVQRRLEAGQPYVVRVLIPPDQVVRFTDQVRGEVAVDTNQLDDKVLFKSDGWPTYHLANVVDDYLMQISHVIRGEEWLSSTPLHVLLYRFLDWEHAMPRFAHLPLILRPDGHGKLSKRDGDRLGFPVFPLAWTDPASGQTSAGFRERGFLPEAVLNFIALLGWHPSGNQELFELFELIHDFGLEQVHKAGARFDFEKAKWFNQEYLKRQDTSKLAHWLQPLLEQQGLAVSPEVLQRGCEVLKHRCSVLDEFIAAGRSFFSRPQPTAAWFPLVEQHRSWLSALQQEMTRWEQDAKDDIDVAVKGFLHSHALKPSEVMPLLRLILTGQKQGPSVADIIWVLGKDEAKTRIAQVLERLVEPDPKH